MGTHAAGQRINKDSASSNGCGNYAAFRSWSAQLMRALTADGVSLDGIRAKMDAQYRLEMLEHIKRGFRSERVLTPHRIWLINPPRHFPKPKRRRNWISLW